MNVSADTSESFLLEVSYQPPGDWDALQVRDPYSEFSQTLHWARSVGDHVPGTRVLWLTVRRSGELVAGLNTVVTSSNRSALGLTLSFPHWDSNFEGTSGGPVIDPKLGPGQQDLVFAMLVDRLAGLRSGPLASCSLVLGPAHEKRFGSLMAARRGWVRQDSLTAAVSLEGGLEEVEKTRLVANKRNERNRGLRRGVEFFSTSDDDLVEQYYRIYEQAAGHWGVPPNPLSLLKALLADPKGGAFFTCVRHEGRVIGGHFNLHHGDRVLVWNGVTDPDYAREYFPATVCFWGDLVESSRRGAAWLDLGGSAGVNSLMGFKKFFGAELQMRGLYFNEAPMLRLMKKGREARKRILGSSESGRWHDKTGGPTAGGGS